MKHKFNEVVEYHIFPYFVFFLFSFTSCINQVKKDNEYNDKIREEGKKGGGETREGEIL